MFCVFLYLIWMVIVETTWSEQPSIVIVGSGPSGIAAATRLLKNNFTNIRILEAENRIGGRVYSVKFGDAVVDLGAEFCHGEEGNIVYSLVKDLDLLKHSNNKFHFFHSDGKWIGQNTGKGIIEFADKVALNGTSEICERTTSMGECLDFNFNSFVAQGKDSQEQGIFADSKDWTASYLASYESAFDLHDITTDSTFKECPGDKGLNWNGHGYKTVLEVLMKKYPYPAQQLPIDDKISLKNSVLTISGWDAKDLVTITTDKGETLEADHVIFTPSVGVLKADHQQLFVPFLPEIKVDAINRIGFGAILKIISKFSERWWWDDGAALFFIWTAEDKKFLKQNNWEWLLDLNAMVPTVSNPKVMTAWYAGKHVPIIESLPIENVLEAQHYAINKFLAPNFNVSKPEEVLRTTWYSNRNFRGTYSYESVKGHTGATKTNFQETLQEPLLNSKKKPTVLFAGEATHPHYFSTVHGAIESGYREADRLIALYKL